MSARFVINDGQHRRAAIEMALRENPEIGDETIAVVFFMDLGLERCQQMFADLNRYGVRPSRSIGVLYDHRDEQAELARLVVFRSSLFKDVVELEKTTLAKRSRRLFTLSALHNATRALVHDLHRDSVEELADIAVGYWEEVAKQFPEWKQVRDGKMMASEIRGDRIHSHGIVLQALGRVGSALLAAPGKGWKSKLKKLKTIDWSRSNTKLWEGRAIAAGQVRKSGNNLTLTTNAIKQHLGIYLSPEEQRVEDAFTRGKRGR